MSVNPFPQRGKFGWRPATFKLRSVLALTVQLEIESILKVREFGLIDRPSRQRCGNDDDPILLGQDQVPPHHNTPSDTDRNVDPRQLPFRPSPRLLTAIDPLALGVAP